MKIPQPWLSRRSLRRPWLPWRRDGTAAVELALISPLLLGLLTSIIDYSRVYHQELQLSAAVASAAQYALLNGTAINSGNAASLAATISGIVANSNGAAWAGATVSVNNGAANANSCWCPTGSLANWSWGAATACGSSCAGGTLAGKFVTIAATRSFSAIFGNYGIISSATLHQSVLVQAQ
jgi:Flp pilus assembly protein TadG